MVVFPDGGGIAGFVYWVLKGVMSWGWVSYGFAIFFFTLFIKLILSPLDFLNKYFSRQNQIKTQALSGELADLQKIYGNDPLAFTRKRQELLRQNGVGGMGSMLVTLVSLIVTCVIFFQVMGALNNIANANIYHQYQALDAVYQEYKDGDEAVLREELNKAYQDNQTSFFWVKNIWQPDTFWANSVMGFDDFNKTQPAEHRLDESQRDTYNAIYAHIDQKSKGANGWLLLVLLAGVASFVSMKLAQVVTAKSAPKPQSQEKPVEIITYSLRDAKNQQQNTQPTVDPAQVNKMMQFIMPAVFMIFALNQSAAFGIYMIASSVISTLLTVGFALLIELIFKKFPPRTAKTKEFDATVINPHAKYFKGGKK